MSGRLRLALQSPELRRVQLAWAISATGSWVFFVVLAVYAYEAGGAAAVGAAAIVRMVPAGLTAPLAGLLADRHPRRDVLLAALAVRSVLLMAVAVAVAEGAPLAVVLVAAALVTMATAAHKPAQAALLPTVAEGSPQLAACNAVTSAVDNAAFLAGSLLGGTLAAIASVEVAFLATAALWALAMLPLARLPRDTVPAYRAAASGARPWDGALRGFADIRADPTLRQIAVFVTGSTFVEGAVDVLLVVVALELLDLGGAGVGWLNACWGAGGLLGGAAALAALTGRRVSSSFSLGALLVGIPLAAAAAVREPLAVALLVAVLGAGYAVIESAGTSALQRATSDEVLGRAFAALESSYWLSTGLGALVAPVLIEALGPRTALVAAGACLPLLAAGQWRALRRLDARETVPPHGFRLLRAIAELAPLPLAVVERAAVRLHELRAAAGTVIVREGDIGDRCYFIATGRLLVDRDRQRVGDLVAGDLFGEIALLRDIPRTATVTAHSDVLLYSLVREDFLAAVGGHPATAAALLASSGRSRVGSAMAPPTPYRCGLQPN